MIKTYIRVQISSEGESPKQIIERMRKIGAVPIVGDYDFELKLEDDKRLFDKLEEIHHSLRGANVRYTLTTRTDIDVDTLAKNRHEVTHYVDQKPIELKKALYKAKLDRWKEMGLDVSELEPLLETDLDHFKTASKEFLRTHLDQMSVVKDRRPESEVDGQVLALIDEVGKSLTELASATGFTEDQVTLSVGRLISSGSARRVQKGPEELFCLVPPPAPIVRKALELAPAGSDEEAQKRLLDSIRPEGISTKDLIRAAKLPREQFAKAIGQLKEKGSIRVVIKAKKEFYFKV
ncbi:MAG: hypothetical protein MUC90_00600 [Thermoplasmata archaeon]|jgi:uncharacterized protein YaaR (DUF327 family)|nr:hypothetical protein [Thermoplasmata archaeon]